MGMLVVITIGWTFFQAFLGTLITIESIASYSPAVAGFISRNQALNVIVKSFVGPGLVALSNILLPMALRVVARTQGVVSVSGVEKSVLYKYFVFQVYNQLIINVVGITGVKGVWNALTNGGGSNKQIWQQVATDIVARGNVVLLYIIAGYTSYGVEIIQGAPLVIGYIKRRYFTLTPRQEYELNDEPEFDFMITYGFLTLVALIGLGYSVIAPIIVPFVTILFILAYVVMKYQLLYVYEVKNETGGTWWPKVFNILCLIIGAFQLMTFGSIVVTAAAKSIRGNGKSQSLLVVVLPFITIAFYLYCSFYLSPQAQYVSKLHTSAFSPYNPNGNSSLASSTDGKLENESEEDALANRVFNPAIVKPLTKVWVNKLAKDLLSTYYRPEYVDLVDYVRKTKTGASRDTYLSNAREVKKRMVSFQAISGVTTRLGRTRSIKRDQQRAYGSADAEEAGMTLDDASELDLPPEDSPISLTPVDSYAEGLARPRQPSSGYVGPIGGSANRGDGPDAYEMMPVESGHSSGGGSRNGSSGHVPTSGVMAYHKR
ncbi:hypothetical protein BASA83_011080 [Batrachochytrium salamandrivorans]|nr:hypothetical protein BASA83_011080 [Batrachochytrium salamandrivorans]